MNNYNKYLKYKKKYLNQKNKNGINLQKISQNKNGDVCNKCHKSVLSLFMKI
jgi:O-glycosyl hydrolase